MAEVKTDQEPSIEEILESIRQIISEDAEGEAKPGVVAKPLDLVPPAPPPSPAVDDNVLELVEKINPEPVVLQQPKPEAPPPQQPPQPQASPVMAEKVDQPMTDETDNLMSPQTANAVTEELSKLLAGNVAVEREEVGRAGKVTLEEMTREMMRPMLKTWIDQNLPAIIEKVVQKEVEKLARRAMDR